MLQDALMMLWLFMFYLQESTTDLCPEVDETSPHLFTLFF